MRDAAGQGADGLHLLRLAQLRFQGALVGLGLLVFGDVGVGAHHAQRPPVVVAPDHHAPREHPLPAAVLATHPVFVAVHRGAPLEMRLPVGPHLLQVVGVGAAVELGGQVAQVVALVTEHALDAVGQKFLAGLQVPVPDPVARALQRELPQRLVRAQGGLDAFAVGHVEQHAHPQKTLLVRRHGAGAAKYPLDLPVGQDDAELAPQVHRPQTNRLQVLPKQRHVVGVAVARDQLGVAHQVLGAEAVDVAHARAHVAVFAPAVAAHVHHEHQAGHLRGDLAQALFTLHQRLLGLDAFGDVFHRALVEQDAPGRIAHHVGVLVDPDPIARLVAPDLGDETPHETVALQLAFELGTPLGAHVPLNGDVFHAGQVFGLTGVAVERHQRRVGTQHPAFGRTAVGPDGQEVEQGGEIPVRRAGVCRHGPILAESPPALS